MFNCKHPFHRLAVKKEQKIEKIDDDFQEVTYYLFCRKCQETLELSHAKLTKTVEEFLKQN